MPFLPSSDITITDTYVVASQAQMLALAATKGDVAVRTDTGQTFILQTEPPSVLGNWVVLPIPAGVVTSVNGEGGPAVSLTAADIGADPTGSAAAAKSAAASDATTKANAAQAAAIATAAAALSTHAGLAAAEGTAAHAEIATQPEVDAGTDDARILTPLKLKNAARLPYDATIGATNADYTTFKAAYDAGKRRILAVSNVTEVADIVVTEDFWLHIRNGVTVDFGEFNVDVDAVCQINVTSDWDGTIRWAFTGARVLFDATGFETSQLNIGQLNLLNQSTVASTGLCNCGFMVTDVLATVPNVSLAMFLQTLYTITCVVRNVGIVGGGSSCQQALTIIKGTVSDISLSGTFVTTAGTYTVTIGDRAVAEGIEVISACNILTYFGALTNVKAASASFGVDVSNGSASLTNVDTSTGTIRILAGTGAKLTNVKCATFSTASGVLGAHVANSDFGAATISGDDSQFSNCRTTTLTVPTGADGNIFNQTIATGAVSITGNNTQFNGGRVGALAGGGATTITVVAGATNTILTGVHTDAAIVDGGTGTSGANNVVY